MFICEDCGRKCKTQNGLNLHKERWCGNIRLDGRYEYLILEDGSKIYTHTYVAEQKIGRKLRDDETVHHIDENKRNNHPDNLEVMLIKDHKRLHGKCISKSHMSKIGSLGGEATKKSPNRAIKLSDEDVVEIRNLLDEGIRVGVIARKFKVHHTTISGIKSGKERRQ